MNAGRVRLHCDVECDAVFGRVCEGPRKMDWDVLTVAQPACYFADVRNSHRHADRAFNFCPP